MIVDYHMHLRGQRDGGCEPLTHSLDTVQLFVERALERGVDEIAFTEHVYYFTQTREIWTLPYQLERCTFDLDAYCEVIGRAKDRGLPVKLGLEVDYVGGRQERLAELLAPRFLRIAGYWYPRGGIPIDVFWQTGTLPPGTWLPDTGVAPYRGRG